MKNPRRPRSVKPYPAAPTVGRTSLLRGAVAGLLALVAAAASAAQLTLDDAIRLALQRNQALKVSAFAPDIARANVLAEYGAFDPALTFRRTYREGETQVSTTPLITSLTQTDDYAVSLGGLAPWGLRYSLQATADNQRGTFNRFSDNFVTFGGISVTQPLLRGFGFGTNLAGLRLAKLDRGIADWQYRQSVINTVTNVIITYSTVIQLREGVRIAQLSRDLVGQLVAQNLKRNQIGQISDAAVLEARANLAAREENVLVALRNAIDYENLLRQLIGETDYPVTAPPLDLEPLPLPVTITVDAPNDLKRAFDLRPDFQAARLGVSQRRIRSSVAQNQLLPSVDFVGSYGYSGMDPTFSTARREVRDRDARAYSAGVVVSIPLTFAEGRGRARAARLATKQAEADLVRLEQDIAIDVAAAAGQIETARNRVTAARSALDLAQQSLEAEQKKFQAGTSTTFLVLRAQELLAVAQNSYARALGDQRRAYANYEREVGTTLINRNITLQ